MAEGTAAETPASTPTMTSLSEQVAYGEREYAWQRFAAAALTGVLTSDNDAGFSRKELAEEAATFADLMMNEFDARFGDD